MMETVVFHLHDRSCDGDVQRMEAILKKHGKKIWFGSLERMQNQAEQMLIITDSLEDVEYAARNDIALIFYEAPNQDIRVQNVDMVVQGFEEIDVKFLQLIYMRHHELPWPIAETRRLYIRESVEEDLDAFRSLYNEKGMTDFIANPEWNGEEGEKKFSQYIHHMYPFYNYGIWTVIEKKEGKIIGRAGLENRSYRGKDVLEIGYLIGKKWQNRGFGEEAARAVEHFALDVLMPQELYAFIYPENRASIRVITKMGYQKIEDGEENGAEAWVKKCNYSA